MRWSLAVVLLIGGGATVWPADNGSISVPVASTNHHIQVAITPPTNAEWVKLSQDPTFREKSNGVSIRIVNLHSNLDFVDLDIRYPAGVPGGRGQAAGLAPGWKELRLLVIPARLSDGGELPSYATMDWLERMLFSDTLGPDERNVPNSVRRYWEQNSYGHVRISGTVYPQWITVNAARYYTGLTVWTVPDVLVHDAVRVIEQQDPTFLEEHEYDFVVILMPGDFAAVYNSWYEQTSSWWDDPDGHFHGSLQIDLPVGLNSRYLSPITNEVNVAVDALHVHPAYRARNILGVWLSSDTNHAGTNYYLGGSFSNPSNEITLGTPLPATNAAVLVDYETGVFYRVYDELAPLFSTLKGGTWFGTFLHEMGHGIGPHITFTGTDYLGDLYRAADLIEYYGLMSGGNHNAKSDFAPLWNDPAYMDAYSKYALGHLLAFELEYGANEMNLRLFAAEEYPYSPRTKLIRVPLHRDGTPGLRRWRSFDYEGEEYLLLELRKKGPVAGIHNFDLALPHEGLLIYHVIEAEPRIIGAFWKNMIRIVDATPVVPSDYFWSTNTGLAAELSFLLTAAPFGPDSGLLEHVQGDSWQEIGNSNLNFFVEGAGAQIIYAKFRDAGTYESLPVSATVILTNDWPDVNANGLDDEWERRFFGSLTSPDGAPGADPDHDEASNWQEFRAGTDPRNGASVLKVSLRRENGQSYLSYPSAPGRFYTLEFTRDSPRSRWIPVVDAVPGNGQGQEWSDWIRNNSSTRYYRVRIKP